MKSPLERAAGWTLERVCKRLWGFTPLLMPKIVERLGPLKALGWMASNMPRYERTLAQMGPLRCHLACVVASLFNGCAYCAYGHARSMQLYYFRERGKLFPLDEHELIGLSHVEHGEARARLDRALQAAGMAEEIPLVQRIQALKLEHAPPASEEDQRLAHLVQMFDVLNSCGIDSQVPFDDAHDPINWDSALKARYAEARLAEGKPRP